MFLVIVLILLISHYIMIIPSEVKHVKQFHAKEVNYLDQQWRRE